MNSSFAVLVVGFHHSRGPEVEFSIGVESASQWPSLPFMALPDGSHARDDDEDHFSCFTIPDWPVEGTRPNTIFGIACNRQLQSSDLIERTPDVTRSVFVVSPDLL